MQGQAEIPDHTHPEYDQMMVKLQEIEGQVQAQAPGGVNQDELDVAPQIGGPMKTESLIRRLIREELTGIPERDIKKKLDGSGPENTSEVPQTTQPANGTAPSGGGFDSDDKTNKEDGLESEVPKPGSEFDKLPIQKNKMNQAKALIERAKRLMREANGEDPTEPNPGAIVKDPKKMDSSVPNKSPMGGTEELGDDASEDPDANVPNSKRPIMKESDDNDEDDDMNKPKTETIDKVYAQLKREMANEVKSHRESFVGLTARSNSNTDSRQEDYLDTKTAVTNTMKEYLTKAGHSRALGFMVPPATF